MSFVSVSSEFLYFFFNPSPSPLSPECGIASECVFLGQEYSCCWEWTGRRAFTECVRPTVSWGKNFLKDPVGSHHYQVLLLAQKLMFTFRFKVTTV